MAKEKHPYDPYGYNTPDDTNFMETKHKKEVIIAAVKSQAKDFRSSAVKPEDFESDKDPEQELFEKGENINLDHRSDQY